MIKIASIERLPDQTRLRLRWPAVANTECDDLHAYTIVAIDGLKVVGYWVMRAPRIVRGSVRVESIFTFVTPRLRRKRIARRLWLAGVKRWKLTHIRARATSFEGASFLAGMIKPLEACGVSLDADFDTINPTFNAVHRTLAAWYRQNRGREQPDLSPARAVDPADLN